MKRLLLCAAALYQLVCIPVATAAGRDLAAEVRKSERAFSKTMADRDLKSFATYIAVEGVFFGTGDEPPSRGREAVVKKWERFFVGKVAPFTWEPEKVEVLPSGKLALSTGPVRDEMGRHFGNFTTIWRLEKDGKWRVVFDKGCPVGEGEED